MKIINEIPKYKLLENVYFHPIYKCFYDSFGNLVNNSTNTIGHNRLRKKFKSTPQNISLPIEYETVKELSVFSGNIGGSWGHFLLGFCNRLWFTFVYPEFDSLNKYIHLNNYKKSNLYFFFENYLNNVHVLSNLKNYIKFDKIYLPYTSFQIHNFAHKAHKLFPEYIASQLIDDTNTNINILYLSRKKLPEKLRKIKNEEEIESLIKSLGGIIIYPEQLSIPEQINYINSSKIIIGCMGSAFHSLLFRVNKDPYKVIILTNKRKITDYNYELVDGIKDIDTTYLYEILEHDPLSLKKGSVKDMIANIDKIKEILPNLINKYQK